MSMGLNRNAVIVIAGLLLPAGGSVFAEPRLRVGPIEGMTESWHTAPAEIDVPLGSSFELEFSWGRNLADLNADGRVDLADYATLSLCYGGPSRRRPSACQAEDYSVADIDADGDVDFHDMTLFNEGMAQPRPFEVERITWLGADDVTHTDTSAWALFVQAEPGKCTVHVRAELLDPLTSRKVVLEHELSVRVLEFPPEEISADWTSDQLATITTDPADAPVRMLVNAFNPQGRALHLLFPGDPVVFEVGVSVDPSFTPLDQPEGSGNRGLATFVYNVWSPQAKSLDQLLNPMTDAPSGFDLLSVRALISSPLYFQSPTRAAGVSIVRACPVEEK